nr:hypothetical protein GCM10020093_046230 [Planobispora longispora]
MLAGLREDLDEDAEALGDPCAGAGQIGVAAHRGHGLRGQGFDSDRVVHEALLAVDQSGDGGQHAVVAIALRPQASPVRGQQDGDVRGEAASTRLISSIGMSSARSLRIVSALSVWLSA